MSVPDRSIRTLRRVLASLLCAATAAAAATPTAPPRSVAGGKAIIESTRVLMGVQANLRIRLPPGRTRAEAEAAMRVVWQRLDELEQVMSDYRPDSELSRLNARAGTGRVPISGDLAGILATAAAFAAETGGAFDATVGPLVDQWRATRGTGRLAAPDEREAARALVGPALLSVDPASSPPTASLARPGMRLDLGGIGKGIAADEAVRVLRRAGFPACLVSIAGDVAAGDRPTDDRGWRVAAGRDGERWPARLEIAGAAASTSGDSSQFIVVDGRRHAHLVDPRTGLGATHRRAVTVLAPRATDADALATALHLLGPGAAPALLAARPGTAARFHEPGGERGRPARTVVVDPHGAWARATAGGRGAPHR